MEFDATRPPNFLKITGTKEGEANRVPIWCLGEEEFEQWLLKQVKAIRKHYKAKKTVNIKATPIRG